MKGHQDHNQNSNNEKSHGSFHGMEADARVLKITGWLTGVYFIIELALGFYSQSVAVISDAFHTFSAVGGILIAFIATKISRKVATKYATFGFKRAEIIGALLNGVFLLFMAFYVLYMGYMRLGQEFDLPTGIMLIAAGGGLITEIISFKLIYKKQKGNLNMQGAYWHIMQTFVGSILIIIAAAVIYFTGWTKIDPILGMAFGVVLLWASYKIIKDVLDILMQTVPKNIDVDDIKNSLLEIDGVKSVNHPHAWVLTSGKNIFSAHLQMNDLSKSEETLNQATQLLKEKYQFYFSTLQIEKTHQVSEADKEMY
jgi:cobalt-zinc-cadmium efflux system protein